MNERLVEIFRNHYLRDEDIAFIREQSESIELVNISDKEWNQIRYLYICTKRPRSWEFHNLPEGCFLGENGSWLIVNSKGIDPGFILSRCGKNLRMLKVYVPLTEPLDLSPMRQLRFLHIGELFDNEHLVMRICGLEQLVALETLRLCGTFDFPVLDIAHMTDLKELTIMENRWLRSVTGFASLKNLKVLELWGVNNLRELNLSGLENLERFSLAEMPRLKGISELSCFQKLKSLCLSYVAADIPVVDLSGMRNLETITLSGIDGLCQILGVEKLDSLTELDISYTPIRKVPEALRGKCLRKLDLSGLHLEELPDWLPELGLTFHKERFIDGICLELTKVKDVDMSIFEQSQEMILQWFESRKAGTEIPLNEIKVVFLGDGEAGKSLTIARLLNDGGEPVDYTDGATPGIVIKNKEYEMDERKIRVHYWDFGGQEILHSMHRIFLTERTLYVVLVNARDETQDARARYWLHNIQSFAKDAPVILVLNKIDQNPNAKVNERDLRERYSNLKQVIKISAKEFVPDRFNREFRDLLLEEIRRTGYLDMTWPKIWTEVKGELEKMSTNYIHGDQYGDICRSCGVDRNEKELLHWFNDLGVSFCCCDDYKLEDYVILRPDWITNALYIILFNHCEGAKNGLIPHRSIKKILGWEADTRNTIRRVLTGVYYQWDEIQYVLEVFHKSQLSFDAGDENEFIPMLCDPNSSPVAQEYEKDEKTLEFRMKFDYLPNNLLYQLMVDRKAELQMDQVWRTGAMFAQEETGFSAVVVIDDDDTLRIFVRSEDPMHKPNTYLTMLKANIDRIRKKMGLEEPENSVVYKLEGKKDIFDYESLKTMLDIGQTQVFSMTWRRMLEICDIMNQAAPEGLEERDKLLERILRSCQNIQGDMRYIGSDEDDRNTRMRDDLEYIGYIVRDQTRRGSSASGKNPGELDIEMRNEKGRPWTMIEALRVKNGTKADWNGHLEKLLGSYNAHGASFLFLVTYVDDDNQKFSRIWEGYQSHLRTQGTERFACVPGSYECIKHPMLADNEYIKVAKCRYEGERYSPTVYHIFVRIGR